MEKYKIFKETDVAQEVCSMIMDDFYIFLCSSGISVPICPVELLQ